MTFGLAFFIGAAFGLFAHFLREYYRAVFAPDKPKLRFRGLTGAATLVAVGLLLGAAFVRAASGPEFWIFAVLFLVLTVAALVDLDTMCIPDAPLVVGALAAGAWIFIGGIAWYAALIGAAAGAMPLWLLDRGVWLLARKRGFGFGDVKLMAVGGLFLGWRGVVAAFFCAFVAGGAVAALLLLTKRAAQGSYMAFGPFLCAGILAALWLV